MMPIDLVLVRHGQSEANIVQKADKGKAPAPASAEAIRERPDWQQRLSLKGREDAASAGKWIAENLGGLASFQALYVSSFLRARETAALLGATGGGAGWAVDERLVGRNWGRFGAVTNAERDAYFQWTAKMKEASPWFTELDNGESLFDVYFRWRDFQETLHRQHSEHRVLIVTHGDFMNVVRYGLERMLTEEWQEMDRDEAQTLKNCSILHYSRRDPATGQVTDRIQWRRLVFPVGADEPDAPDAPGGGEWVALPHRRLFSSGELLRQAEHVPKLT